MKQLLSFFLFSSVLAHAQDISSIFQQEAVPGGSPVSAASVSLSPTSSLTPLSPSLPFAPQAPDRPAQPDQPLSPDQFMAVAGAQSAAVTGDVSPSGATLMQTKGSAGALSSRIVGSVQAVTARLENLSITVGGAGFR
jgi:hypothetical protein